MDTRKVTMQHFAMLEMTFTGIYHGRPSAELSGLC